MTLKALNKLVPSLKDLHWKVNELNLQKDQGHVLMKKLKEMKKRKETEKKEMKREL